MATFQADIVRAAAIELRQKVTDLYVAALPVFRAAAQWRLNGLDPDLPSPFAVKVQIDSFKALSVSALRLEWVTALQSAGPDDGLVYPPLREADYGRIAFEDLAFNNLQIGG